MTRYEAVKTAVRKFEDAPFEYGGFDCCEFVREVATLYRGADPAPELVYMNEADAEYLIADFGGLSSLMTYVFGDPISAEDTEVADALKLKLPKTGEVMGVRVPDGALVPVMRGLLKVDLRYAIEGWRI
jgi:hypothetical protein